MGELLQLVGEFLGLLVEGTEDGRGCLRVVHQVARLLLLLCAVALTVWLWHVGGPWPVAALALVAALVLWLVWRRTHFTLKDVLTGSRSAEQEAAAPKPEWKPPTRYSVVLDGINRWAVRDWQTMYDVAAFDNHEAALRHFKQLNASPAGVEWAAAAARSCAREKKKNERTAVAGVVIWSVLSILEAPAFALTATVLKSWWVYLMLLVPIVSSVAVVSATWPSRSSDVAGGCFVRALAWLALVVCLLSTVAALVAAVP
jgi:hypothetical protein